MDSQALELAPGTHLCAMYRGVAQRDEVLGPYVSEGPKAGHTCLVAVSDQDPDRVHASESADDAGRETTVSTALVDDGAPFVRLSAEATWWLTQLPSVADLMDAEVRLNAFAARHPQSILCLYDIDDLGTGVVFEAMKVHPRIWLSGRVLEHPFYEPAG